jgi:outer membrane protein insertion porin family
MWVRPHPPGAALALALMLLTAADARGQSPSPVPAASQTDGSASGPAAGPPSGDVARYAGASVIDVVIDRAGARLDAPQWVALVDTRPGRPLSLREVRASLMHFFNTGLFEGVEVAAEPVAGGVRLTYRLRPARIITGYTFAGDPGLDESVLRRGLRERFGERPAPARIAAAADALRALLLDYGFYDAQVTPSLDEGSTPETATLRFAVAAGRRARIGALQVTGRPLQSAADILRELDLTAGAFFDGPALERRLERVRDRIRRQGYYEASIVSRPTPRLREGSANAAIVDLTIDVEPGPLVTLRFEGDPIPEARRAELVPVQREATVDEDLLEDSKRRIEDFLKSQGHWKCEVDYRREATDGRLDIVFRVAAGDVYRLAGLAMEGVTAFSAAEVEELMAVRAGDLYVAAAVDTRTTALVARYHRNGYSRVRLDQDAEIVNPPPGRLERGGWVRIRLIASEGPRILVGTVQVTGQQALRESDVRGRLQLQPGMPFVEPLLATDRDAIAAVYLDRGFARVRVDARPAIDPEGRANIVFTIAEGEQVVVDRVLIVGNRRTSTETIQRALTIAPDKPLGVAELLESQRRLRALGLFSRVTLTDVGEPGESRRDLVVTVEEAPPTTIGYGAGVEAGQYLRQEEVDGPAEYRVELAGRGFFEVGRRNLWGSNRSVNLFTRVSIRPTTVPEEAQAGNNFGFNEYRVLATFREPSVFGTQADGRVTGYFEQAVRSSFNFVRRGVQVELAQRLRDRINLVGAYSLSEVRLFDERIAPVDRPDIDRLFPQVRLSKFAVASRRDTRDDVLDPTRGMVIGVDGDLAARAIGSQVGFVKGFGEVFAYRLAPTLRRSVVAAGARLGLARGFTRTAVRVNENGEEVIGPDGQPIIDVVSDLPASERFFAGGDTTVRGFARDALGDAGTLDPNGFPTGGHALVILNAELRTPVWREVGSVVFVDAGNVFRRASELDLGELRVSAGFGVRYKSPIGPVRVDVGFKLDRREPVEGQREPRYAVHFSIGQAF